MRSYTGHTSPTVCCIIHVELVCGGQGSVHVVWGMHWYHKHKVFFLFCRETKRLVSVSVAHNEIETFHFKHPNCDLFSFALLEKDDGANYFLLRKKGRTTFLNQFFMLHIVVFNMAACFNLKWLFFYQGASLCQRNKHCLSLFVALFKSGCRCFKLITFVPNSAKHASQLVSPE